MQPQDPPLLPLSELQPAAAADLEASRSRSRTHSEVSEAPTIQYPDQAPDQPRQPGQEEAPLPEPSPLPPPDPPSRISSVAPTEFYSDIAKAHGHVRAQLGDEQDFMFWQNMGKHNLVLWLDYTEEATTYHTLDMNEYVGCGSLQAYVSYDDCNMVQSIAIDHKYSPSSYRTKMLIHSGNGFFTEFWYDPQALDTAHWLCDSFADFIAPVSFVSTCSEQAKPGGGGWSFLVGSFFGKKKNESENKLENSKPSFGHLRFGWHLGLATSPLKLHLKPTGGRHRQMQL